MAMVIAGGLVKTFRHADGRANFIPLREYHPLFAIVRAVGRGVERLARLFTESKFDGVHPIAARDGIPGQGGLWGGVAVGEALEEGGEGRDAGCGDADVHLDRAPQDQHRRVSVLGNGDDLDHAHHRADGREAKQHEEDYQHGLLGIGLAWFVHLLEGECV